MGRDRKISASLSVNYQKRRSKGISRFMNRKIAFTHNFVCITVLFMTIIKY